MVIQNLGVWQTFSWKWIKQVCYFKGKQWAVFVPSDKNWALKWKIRNLENLYLPLWVWWLPSVPNFVANLVMIKCSFFKKIFWVTFIPNVGPKFITRSTRVTQSIHWASQVPHGCTFKYWVRKVPTFGRTVWVKEAVFFKWSIYDVTELCVGISMTSIQTDTVSDFFLITTNLLRSYHLLGFSIVSEKNISSYLKRLFK